MVAHRAGVELALAKGDGLIVEIEITGCRLVSGRFFPALQMRGIKIGRDAGAAGGILPLAQAFE